MSELEENPLVSVCVVTYNQEQYIGQCLQSILDQETSFAFEVIVGDDGSKDGTRAIVSELAQRYPGKLVPVFHQENVGPTKNYLSVHNLARGKYVAHCDGDDYWLPGKLAHQVGILESDAQIVLVAESGQKLEGRQRFDIDFLLRARNPVIHSSKVYRKDRVLTRDSEVPLLDFYFNVEHGREGVIFLEERKYTVYRENVGVLKRMGYRYYTLNCEAAEHALALGAPRAAAYCAARDARHALIKNALFDKDWELLEQLLVPNAIETRMRGAKNTIAFDSLLRFAVVRYAFHLLLKAKRAYA